MQQEKKSTTESEVNSGGFNIKNYISFISIGLGLISLIFGIFLSDKLQYLWFFIALIALVIASLSFILKYGSKIIACIAMIISVVSLVYCGIIAFQYLSAQMGWGNVRLSTDCEGQINCREINDTGLGSENDAQNKDYLDKVSECMTSYGLDIDESYEDYSAEDQAKYQECYAIPQETTE